MPPRPNYRAAASALAERDLVMKRLVSEVGSPTIRVPMESHFGALLRAIVYQQLAGRAAAAIHARVIAALGEVTPEAVLATPEEVLRGAGLSGNKLVSIRDLASKVIDGTVVLDPRRLGRVSDEEMIERLAEVRGIGRWTAEMFLMFQLRRLDIWPVGDLGVRRGYGLAYEIPMPTPRQLEALGEPFRPYRSVAAWYCWRAAELYGTTEKSVLTT
jgi:DNA-3-methyladenine glycosylase II